MIYIIIIFILQFGLAGAVFGQEGTLESPPAVSPLEQPGEDIQDVMSEFDYFYIDGESSKVSVASLFTEDELMVGSSVSSINAHRWKQLGARRTYEALNNEMAVQVAPSISGIYVVAIRGYTTLESMQGVATLIDGIPVNSILLGTSLGVLPNPELGVMDKIEIIKGPGSSIYGSDAFHGVVLFKTFESDKDHYEVEGAGAFPLYGDGNLKISQGFADDLIRVDAAFSASRQGDQDLEYEYRSGGETGTGKRKWEHDSMTGVIKVRLNTLDKLKIKLGSYMSYFNCEENPGLYQLGTTVFLEDKKFSSNDAKYYSGTAKAGYTFDNEISLEADAYYSESDLEYTLQTGLDSSVTQMGHMYQQGMEVRIKQPDNPLNLQWLVGVSYKQSKLDDNSYFKTIGNDSGPDEDLGAKGFTRKIMSAYTQLKWAALPKKFFLLLGSRIDDYEDSSPEYDLGDFGTNYSPRVGLILLPGKESSVKALYGRAFKAPNQVQIFGFPGVSRPSRAIKPETIDVYELNYIYKKKKVKIKASGFYSSWKDTVFPRREPSSLLITYNNVSTSNAYGGEAEVFYSFDPFAVELGYSFVRSSAENVMNVYTLDRQDIEFYFFPRHSIQGALHYNLKPVDLNFYFNNRFYYKWKGHTIKDIDYLPLYHRADLNMNKSIGSTLEFYLDIRNIFNRKNHVPGVTGPEDGNIEPGISILLRASYKI